MTISFDKKSTQTLFQHYSYIVDRVVQKLAGKHTHLCSLEQLRQRCYIGLVEAIDCYPAEKGICFETFASIRIQGEIIGRTVTTNGYS